MPGALPLLVGRTRVSLASQGYCLTAWGTGRCSGQEPRFPRPGPTAMPTSRGVGEWWTPTRLVGGRRKHGWAGGAEGLRDVRVRRL